ncbi:MAG: 2,3-bisphosphoglycerate-dependent phosphoglycerate mutase [Betaproteobacteria bacterium]|nr:2,3-bisphosphoglycerate-dependent phosphoglycerate mutase [Betaproteobacteria bacterium]
MKNLILMLALMLLPYTQAFAESASDRQQPATKAAHGDRTYQVILLRHGESVMNTQRRTSGWGDTHLTDKGVAAGLAVGELLKKEGISIDAIHTSYLARAIKTSWLALEGMDMMWVPVHTNWRLNETNQGAFEGKTRDEQVAQWGEEHMKNWEASFDMRPPLMANDDPKNPASDPRYSGIPNVPQAESMKDTLERIRAYWQNVLIPELKSGKTIMVVGHSNALRSLSKSIDDSLEEATLKKMDIPNTIPVVYTLDANMKPISRRTLNPSGL